MGSDELPIVSSGPRNFGYSNTHGPLDTSDTGTYGGGFRSQLPSAYSVSRGSWTTSLGTTSYWSNSPTTFFMDVLVEIGARGSSSDWGNAAVFTPASGAGDSESSTPGSGLPGAIFNFSASDIATVWSPGPRLRFLDPWFIEQQKFFAAWADVESTQTTNNPLATTWPTTSTSGYPGLTCKNCNPNAAGICNGVKNYSTFEQGVRATANTLKRASGSTYENILKFLRKQLTDSTGAIIDTAREALLDDRINSELATWGTQHGWTPGSGAGSVFGRLARLEGYGSVVTSPASQDGAPLAWVNSTTGNLCPDMTVFTGMTEMQKCGVGNSTEIENVGANCIHCTHHELVYLIFNAGDVAALDYATRTRKSLNYYDGGGGKIVTLQYTPWKNETFYSYGGVGSATPDPPILDPTVP